MFVCPPVAITSSMVTASNISEDDEAAWAAGVYALGDKVMHDHSVWQSLISSNSIEPGTDATAWVRLSATNKFRPFDLENSAQASNPEEITYTIKPGERITVLGFISVDATEITVTITTPSDGVVYTKTAELLRVENRGTFWDWYFAPQKYLREYTFLDLPGYGEVAEAEIEITISKPGDDARVGEIVMSHHWEMGSTLYETEPRIRDFSVNERDAFGNAVLNKSFAVRGVTFRVAIATDDTSFVLDEFAAVTSTRVLFVGGANIDRYGTTILGTTSEIRVPLEGPNATEVEFDVEGFIA
ncbi:hypothetical protein [Sulfitobacter dubius]|uniref:Carbohydrate binding domain-containing protein n=1 Tax=Sulfitobacter dubius TaxID=218673 RepID=A0ABY3ZIX8_9RHOB|nr:hypothetical protein [Sulfitobacter dubius]UOA14536.1 hypothetical protein DSM109990_01342 [Sulfitobacter dubius]